MIPQSPKPLRLTINDQIETRIYQAKQSMRFPVDEETTAKLKRVITLDTSAPLPWYRRLLRWLRRTR
jgi:hypothetical protein